MSTLTKTGAAVAGRYLESLRHLEFRKLWIATLCSQGSAWALIVARAALVFELTGSPAWTGYVTFAAMIPSVLMSPIAGYLADRFDRRTVLAAAYATNTAHNLLLAVLVVTGAIEPWHILVLSVLNGMARATQMPSAQALLANMVPRESIFNAVSLYQATQHGSRFVGPFLILIVLWVTGHQDWVFFLSAGLYAVGLGTILSIRTSSRGVIEEGAGVKVVLGNLAAGLSYMCHHRLVLSLILLVVAHCGMTMSFESLFPVLSQNKLGLEGGAGIMRGASYLMVAYGAGALVTALGLAGVRSEHVRGRLFFWLAIFSGLTPVALGLSANLPLAMLAAVGMGASQGGFMAVSHGILQSIVPDGIRGRLMGVYSWHTQGFMASFNLVNASVVGATALTASLILGIGGLAFVAVVALSIVRVPLRQLYARGAMAT